jgi:hypothetical protein
MRLRTLDGAVHTAADVDGTVITGCRRPVGDDDRVVAAVTPVTCPTCLAATPRPRPVAAGFSHADTAAAHRLVADLDGHLAAIGTRTVLPADGTPVLVIPAVDIDALEATQQLTEIR